MHNWLNAVTRLRNRLGRLLFSSLAALMALLTGCLTDEGQGPSLPASIARLEATNAQQGIPGAQLPLPLQVSVLTEDGQPALRGEVAWEVTDGGLGATVSDARTVADGSGVAQVVVRLGAVGSYTVRAALVLDPEQAVTFSAEAIPAPELSGLTPTTFSAGDQIDLVGQNFTAETRFEVEGKTATVVAGTLTSTNVSVVVPSCLPGGTVSLRAVLMGSASSPITGTFTAVSAPLNIEPGNYLSVTPDQVAGCASIPAAPPGGAEYLVAPQSVSGETDAFVDYRFGTGALIPTTPSASSPRPLDIATQFHNFLRRMEAELPRAQLPSVALEGALAQPPVVGDRRDFVVCNRIPCRLVEEFDPVRAEAMFVGRRAAIYQDLDAPASGLTPADFDELGRRFDDVLYDVDTRAFGAESDVDGNDHVIILLSPVVNGLTPEESCGVSFVSGFFFSIDINPLFSGDPRSNDGEVFYALVADPQGSFGCSHTRDDVMRNVPVTFVHEFQHMISYHQHVLLRGGEPEEDWLNEGLSHLAEELAAFRFLAADDSTSFSRFAIGNLANAYDYLEAPAESATVWNDDTGELNQRGANWLFLRWLVDHFGEGITRQLLETNFVGADNIERVTGEPFPRLVAEWFLSNWVSDLPDFESPERLTYTTWRFRTTFSSLNQQAPNVFPLPFPLVPRRISTTSPFSETGTLRAGTGAYYIVSQAGGDPGRALEFVSPNGQPLGETASPVLNIIRIR